MLASWKTLYRPQPRPQAEKQRAGLNLALLSRHLQVGNPANVPGWAHCSYFRSR